MRTFEEIQIDLDQAFNVNDTSALLDLASELDLMQLPLAEASASRARGWVFFLRGDFSLALERYHNALALFEELGDVVGIAHATGNIGMVCGTCGDHTAALEHFHRCLSLHEQLGNLHGVASYTNNIGIVHEHTGNYPAALEHHHRALSLLDKLGSRSGVAGVLGNIGNLHRVTGSYPAAMDHLHRALALHEELGDIGSVAKVTIDIGNVYHNTGNYDAALQHYQRALALHESSGDRYCTALVLGNIGGAYYGKSDYAMALEYYHQALTIHQELNDHSGIVYLMSNIIGAQFRIGADEEAQTLMTSLDSMQILEPDIRILRSGSRAELQMHRGEFDAAEQTLHSALSEAIEYGLPSEQANMHQLFRDLALQQKNLSSYVEHNDEYTRITKEINGKDTITTMAMQEAERNMAKERAEHERYLAVLHSTLPRHIADRVARGEQVNDHYDNAAVIFLDIVGFTTLSNQLTSEQVVQLLDSMFTALDAVCKKHDVVKIKTIGDSYMAVAFEAASSEQRIASSEERIASSEQRVANAALDMLHAISHILPDLPSGLLEDLLSDLPSGLQVRIGLHCGAVTAGVIGTTRMQYDVWGDTVNVASRMESTSAPGRIHVSEAFANAVKGEIAKGRNSEGVSSQFPVPCSLIPRGELEIKGKGMMTTYWLESSLS